jgi:hypothetical protein
MTSEACGRCGEPAVRFGRFSKRLVGAGVRWPASKRVWAASDVGVFEEPSMPAAAAAASIGPRGADSSSGLAV